MALPVQTSLLRRIIVGVALLGVLLVTHLWLQSLNGFENGCSGLAPQVDSFDITAAPTESGCATVTSGPFASFLGVSNILWGFLFYGLLSVLRLAYTATANDRLRLASFGLAGIGMGYTGYLVYLQAVVIKSFCALCMTSAALVTVLLILHILEHRKVGSVGPEPRRGGAEPVTGLPALRAYVPIFGVFAVLLGASLVLFQRGGADDVAANENKIPLNQLAAAGAQANAQNVDTGGACEYDPNMAPIADFSAFTAGASEGAEGSAVQVVEIFDPNCPHCKTLGESLDQVIAENGEAAEFFYVPYPLRQESLGQVVALTVAEEQGLFFEMKSEMFRRQDSSWGMTLPELVATVNEAGMDGDAFDQMIKDQDALQPYLDIIQTKADAVSEAFASPDGGISVPKLAINGRIVAPTNSSYSPRCIAEFIAQAGSGETVETAESVGAAE
ncbi:MAG: vitamin K epoxide reductase family protein [Bacteroidota bacterium]